MIDRTEQEIMASWQGDLNKPLVSICTISYNHEQYIAEALDSFLMQETTFPYEMVIDDDCSPDGTAAVIKSYVEKYPNIIKANLRKKNVGMMSNFFDNMKRSQGEYIALCEGDDYWNDPLKLQKQVNFLKNNIEYISCFHDSVVRDQNGSIIKGCLICNTKDYDKIELLSSNAFITVHSVMFRNVIEYPSELQESMPFGDILLWHLMGFYGKAKYLDVIEKASYRRHSTGAWSSLDQYEKFQKTLLSKQILKKSLQNKSINTKLIDYNINTYILYNIRYSIKIQDFELLRKIFLKCFTDKDLSMSRIFLFSIKVIMKRIQRNFKRLVNA